MSLPHLKLGVQKGKCANTTQLDMSLEDLQILVLTKEPIPRG